MSVSDVLTYDSWDTNSIRYMQPRITDRGGRMISIISSQSNRGLKLTTPQLMTWGVSDYVDPTTGESDNRYTIQLSFPLENYQTPETNTFLEKLKVFEQRVIDDAVQHSEAWFGKTRSKEVIKETYYSYLKYSKDKLTRQPDYSKPPSFRPKVHYQNGEWKNLEIYSPQQELLFPDKENTNVTPVDLIPKSSKVMCLIQCTGIWTAGGNSWGVSWKMIQCIVKPRENYTVFGKCQIPMSDDEQTKMEKQEIMTTDPINEEEEEVFESTATEKTSTEVEDSDEEADEEVVVEQPEPVKPKKKVTKKAAPVEDVEEEPVKPKKKVTKKKVTAATD
tara:strand:+ start:4086 stop:5084 length:999 start_codon:yes stop_codon:yes gene_type:complete